MQIQISWLLQKPTDLDGHCLQNKGYPGSAGQGLKYKLQQYKKISAVACLNLVLPLKTKTFNMFFFQASDLDLKVTHVGEDGTELETSI